MRIPRTPRELVRAALDLAIIGTLLSALTGVAALFFVEADGAHEVFVIGISVTVLVAIGVLVIAVVVKVVEIGSRP